MPNPQHYNNDFLNRITQIIEENISNEQFGVSELAREIGMSRSNLLRKIKKPSNLSVSQFIRQVRLKEAMELLKQQNLTVSEVSYRVGFSSTSYFIKCFREFYGYPPGELGKRDKKEPHSGQEKRSMKKMLVTIAGLTVLILSMVLLFFIVKPGRAEPKIRENSIAVLPFKNDSNDSTNIYLINGLMESLLDNLQKIEDLRVISRTSVETYRHNPLTIPEIARELNVNYLVEGSGQKVGNQILLNIQLIEASTDTHIWAERYKRETGDIFELQQELAKSIADEIEAIITPEEAAQIEKVPTRNLEAYDYFLKGQDPFQRGTREGLEEAIPYFEKAIVLDPKFALAHAYIAIAYAYLDIYQYEKKHTNQIDYYADKALLFDPKLPQSLIAKAMFYITQNEYEQAIPYLEKALEYHPNSSRVINILSDFYTRYIPDTEKYLEYALMGIGLDIAAHDSVEASYIYLHLSNALIQSGFVNEAAKYLDISLQYNPDNYYAELLKPYILLAKGGSLLETKELLLELLQINPGRYDIMKELGVICYFMHDYECAWAYYSKASEITEAQGMNLYSGEKAKMGLALSKLGRTEESKRYFQEYLEFAENDPSIYRHLSLAAYYSYINNTAKAIKHMELFSQQEKYPYWYILFLGMDDPLFEKVNELPEFQEILRKIDLKFWRYHEKIKDSLKEKNLL